MVKKSRDIPWWAWILIAILIAVIIVIMLVVVVVYMMRENKSQYEAPSVTYDWSRKSSHLT